MLYYFPVDHEQEFGLDMLQGFEPTHYRTDFLIKGQSIKSLIDFGFTLGFWLKEAKLQFEQDDFYFLHLFSYIAKNVNL